VLTAVAASLLGCATSGADLESIPTPGNPGLLLIAHGNGNSAAGWPARLIRVIRARHPDTAGWDLYAYDWEEEALHVLTASRSGTRIGRDLARYYVEHGDPYDVIHLIGQSLGAFLVQGFIDEYRDLGGAAAIQVTFLDPFLISGVLGFGHGVRRFGEGSDYAEDYFVRDDPMPGTNRPLRNAFNVELDARVPPALRESFRGPHWYAVEFYMQSVGDSGPGFARSPLVRLGGTGAVEGEGSDTAFGARLRDHFAELRRLYPAGATVTLDP